MRIIIVFLLVYLILWIGIRQFIIATFLQSFHSYTPPLTADGFLPRAGIVLCLRGADPVLKDCLAALSQQDYPNYQVQIVVDHQEDPAWEIVTQFCAQRQAQIPFHVSVLEDRSPQRSLKCSAILQAIEQLDSDCEVVALIDADVVPHPTWLQELVRPLANPAIGVTSGNRWYLPDEAQFGSLVRHLWNYSAVMMMQLFQISWGGTLAMRVKTMHEIGLLKMWDCSLVEDTPIYQALVPHGLRVQFVPSLWMVNRENCDLLDFLKWSQRQSLFSRLYHPRWDVIRAYNACFVIFYSVGLVALGWAIWSQQWVAAGSLATILLFDYLVFFFIQLRLLRRNIHQALENRGETIPSHSLTYHIRLFLATPILVACCVAVLLVQWLNRVSWRGIVYEVEDAWNIQIQDYQPYQRKDAPIDSMTSL